MEENNNWLANQFEENRPHLRAVAYRMLGSLSEAEDAVQEGWLRLSRSDTSAVENLSGWLTTVVARVCLDMLRSRKSKHEESLEEHAEPSTEHNPRPQRWDRPRAGSPARRLSRSRTPRRPRNLAPAERLAFVLHDMFDLSFEEIAPIVGRSPTAARQLASRARRRVQGADTTPAAPISPASEKLSTPSSLPPAAVTSKPFSPY